MAQLSDAARLRIQTDLIESRIARIAAVQVALHGADEQQWSKRARSRVAKHRSLLASLLGLQEDGVVVEVGDPK